MTDAIQTSKGKHLDATNDKCLQCRACLECDEAHCLFHPQGDPLVCRMEKCKYCMDFLKKQRLYMNNVG